MSIIKTAAVEEGKNQRKLLEQIGGAGLIGGSLMLGSDIGKSKAVTNFEGEGTAPSSFYEMNPKKKNFKFGKFKKFGKMGSLFK